MPTGREGKRGECFSFALPQINFSRTGGARGSGSRWIATLGGGAFDICIPAGREGERGELCCLRLRRLIFPDQGAVFSGRSLHSAAALLMYACQRVGGQMD